MQFETKIEVMAPERIPGLTASEVQVVTEAKLVVNSDIKEMDIAKDKERREGHQTFGSR